MLWIAAVCPPARGELIYRPVEPGIERAETITASAPDAPPMKVWVYRPAVKIPAGSLPCVFIAPAGAAGITGMTLAPEDVPEHLPYVRQGFVVVAYEVDGAIGGGVDEAGYLAAVRAFVKAEGGIANLRAAVAAATGGEPAIDRGRLYAAGHSSAGTLALMAAAQCEAIRAAVAYAPLSDVESAIGPAMLEVLDGAVPGLKRLAAGRQPKRAAASIRCPVMLFHAADDEVVPVAQTRALADAMKAAGNEPLVIEPARGGHVEAMTREGLQAGAAWLADRAKRDREKQARQRDGER